MKSYIQEIGVVDHNGKVHKVNLNPGLNVVTGKSSTGKSALIEIFDYCFGSEEYTVPKGIITQNAAIYFVQMQVGAQQIVLGRSPKQNNRAFFKREGQFDPARIGASYFTSTYFRPLADFKDHVRSLFLDIDDVDDSLIARNARRYRAKAPTPSIRSLASFMLQHQNLIANKHALFYRFDEKAKRDQVIEHTKIFLGLVDQKFFHLSQEKEERAMVVAQLKREQDASRRASEAQKQKIEPALQQLVAAIGLTDDRLNAQAALRHPEDFKQTLNEIVRLESIQPLSNGPTQRYLELQAQRSGKTSELRKLQREAASLERHIGSEDRFLETARKLRTEGDVTISKSVCPFCHTEHEQLRESADRLQQAILQISIDMRQVKPTRARFESSLAENKRKIETVTTNIRELTENIRQLEQSEKLLVERKSLYETILIAKARFEVLLDSLASAEDTNVASRLIEATRELAAVNQKLDKYDYKKELKRAGESVTAIMQEIGQNFEFEESYRPINLHFSFETFDLYHLTEAGEKIFLRSMGSGANWLYSHVTLFLALHRYFASLGEKCAVPSILFIDQPTQVYFPSFRLDKAESFTKERLRELEQRSDEERDVDDDIAAVENLFSQLSAYCSKAVEDFGFAPQIIVTDHADNLELADGTSFEALVNGNRWRHRGLIHPVPSLQSRATPGPSTD
jgi:hypothetical protein